MASQKEELSLLDGFLNLSRGITQGRGEDGQPTLTQLGQMAQQGKLPPVPDSQSVIEQGLAMGAPASEIMKAAGDKGRRDAGAGREFNTVADRTNRLKSAAAEMVNGAPELLLGIGNIDDPAVGFYAKAFDVGEDELKSELQEMRTAAITEAGAPPLGFPKWGQTARVRR